MNVPVSVLLSYCQGVFQNFVNWFLTVNSWFSSYLKNRTQTTQVDHYISDKAVVGFGVPQGSVLGPLLFLLYVNNIHRCSNKLRFYLFADDTNILYADKNLKDLETTVNNELQNLYNWLTANKLTLNIKKSNFVIFHPYQKRLAYQPKLCMFDNEKNKYVRLESKLSLYKISGRSHWSESFLEIPHWFYCHKN